jgi:hypothetical protein
MTHCLLAFALLLGGPALAASAVPGVEPAFARDVTAVLGELKKQGFDPRVAEAYRDPKRQQFLYNLGVFLELFGAQPMTRAQGGQSCHNHQEEGAASSLAVDILPPNEEVDTAKRAAFFHALGKASRARGLGWGGAWPRKNTTWKKYGLGWDPGHVQSAQCRW